MKKRFLALSLGLACLLLAQEKVDEAASPRIRSEEAEHSQILHTLHMLADRYGPRVTGTPNHEAAARWARDEMAKWGMKNTHLEAWEFGHPGWLNERASAFLVAPVYENLKFEVLAWTASTKGTVTASTVQLVPPQGPEAPAPEDAGARGGRGGFGGRGPVRLGPTKDEMAAWVAANKDKGKGKIVLIGKAAVIPVAFDATQKRRPDDQVKQQYDPNNPTAGRGFGFGGGGRGPQDPSR